MSSQPPSPQTEDQPESITPEQPDPTWAAPVSRLKTENVPASAVNLNVEGRRLMGPIQGFGQLWQKTYRVRMSGAQATPAQVVKVWKENFQNFWPKGYQFYGRMTGIKPGEVAVLNLAGPGGIQAPGGLPLISTGVLVIYADDESFSFMTPQGHMFCSIITFSAYEEGATVAQIQALLRASDPLYELIMRIGGGHKTEDDFWHATLRNLAAHFGVQGQVQQQVTCVDPRLQWSQAKNIWHNAAIRTALYTPVAMLRKLVRRDN